MQSKFHSIEIQKIIYLIDSISAYLFILSGIHGHQTYYYGPYDKYIQNALDALTIRDLTEMHDIHVSNNTIACNYLLTETGIEWTENLVRKSHSIKYRLSIIDSIFYSLTARDAVRKVKDLVYAEPVYVTKKEYGHHYDLPFDIDNAGHHYLALIEHYLKSNSTQPNIYFVTDIYIDYLFARDHVLSGQGMDGGDKHVV